MPELRIFFAQPIDSVSVIRIKKNARNFEHLMEGLPVQVVAPYIEDISERPHVKIDREFAKEIISKDYLVLDTCAVLLVDLRREDRQAIGMIFEMSRAREKSIPIIVYTGKSAVGRRIWIVGTADFICRTWEEVRECISRLC